MRKKNVRIAEIVLVVALVIFVVLAAVTYVNLNKFMDAYNQSEVVTETTTVVE